MLRILGQRVRQSAERQRQREAALKAAREAERRKMTDTNLPQAKRAPPKTRAPLIDPLGTPFAGAVQGQAAKWEAEIHKLGRQIIGQMDSKMAALQAITLDANRTANRLEILVEHLEHIARTHVAGQQEMGNNLDAEPAEESPPTVIPAEESAPAATPLAAVLQELTEDIEDFRHTVEQSTTFAGFTEQVEQATVLRMKEVSSQNPDGQNLHGQNLRSEVEMLANYGLEPQEIARRLNISAAEVDLVLQVQQNRTE